MPNYLVLLHGPFDGLAVKYPQDSIRENLFLTGVYHDKFRAHYVQKEPLRITTTGWVGRYVFQSYVPTEDLERKSNGNVDNPAPADPQNLN
jgi:hypothetical protein